MPRLGPIRGGTELRRRGLAGEAIWLGRLVASLLPDEPEALGLLALMLCVEARRGARRTAAGASVPLDEQDVGAWDVRLIEQAEALLLRASGLGIVGRFQLEAAVQSAQGVRRRTGRSDWAARARLLALTGATDLAAAAYRQAIGMENDPAVRRFLQDRLAGLRRLAGDGVCVEGQARAVGKGDPGGPR